ncbi:hypothetical protein DFQ05_2200 [Winogradskyella wandonensis]|uniref:DUF4377 domain-containing protein n=1 Tax=Winogradskyella wandonensis TaxID=1442586 RepID=A0A4R1KPJ6_9FLAO|nr:hypothetical protein [Winogradskyella wandonensis]TCK66914.1 hypothetical protein DFQ05_2200 [Winogradskyella wandonensis]
MKALFIAIFVGFSLLQEPEVFTLEATFIEYEDETFYFEDKDEKQYAFSSQNEVSKNQFDLTKGDFANKKFKIKYVVETEMDDDDEEYEVFKIISLELLK